ncbi:radical SAM protein [Flavobacterium sp. MAH-1]|uniref:Radical SAM protein n=1 Tax=Flavobacterium agri TaxID=2743471 RepID=A0A7Y8Y250_9FLAO|nr:radical SAM/SPASM domain-containing protein [Flavobacterium agri]NUY80473.1 radical SAM protein [Flavobacterium agri]NYA70498.1 radical SAM protein [Flavobacterium agri]
METASDFNMVFPPIIEIQTYSRCNANCIICPYEATEAKYGITKMPDSLLQQILDEIRLNSHHVKTVIPYLNNEPSLDNRLIPTLQYLKSHGLKTEVSSNFSGFTESKIDTLIEQELVDDLRISFFGGTKASYSQIMPGLNFDQTVKKIEYFISKASGKQILDNTCLILVLSPELDISEETVALKKIFPHLRIRFFGYLDRAGNNTLKNDTLKTYDGLQLSGCSLKRPFERCCIDASGNVILCSQDWDKEVIVGNVSQSSITQVWNSVSFKDVRDMILGKSHSDPDFICYNCKLAEFQTSSRSGILNFKGDRYVDQNDVKLLNPDSF